MNKPIHIGAEAELYKVGSKLIKIRIKKNYRIKEIDDPLRKRRTKREAKVLSKAECNIPKLLSVDDEKMIIEMEYIDGDTLKDVLDDSKNRKDIVQNFAKQVAILHNQNIIHGDLTTSNAILKDNQVYLIDFGLSFFSHKLEDMATDLKLLNQAFESKHHKIFIECNKYFIQTYKKDAIRGSNVLERLVKVEKRGRYKGKSSKT